jgi:hypothetical protein
VFFLTRENPAHVGMIYYISQETTLAYRSDISDTQPSQNKKYMHFKELSCSHAITIKTHISPDKTKGGMEIALRVC